VRRGLMVANRDDQVRLTYALEELADSEPTSRRRWADIPS
jgi:hypothetical protein